MVLFVMVILGNDNIGYIFVYKWQIDNFRTSFALYILNYWVPFSLSIASIRIFSFCYYDMYIRVDELYIYK